MFKLLTDEYILVLASSKKHFDAVKAVREEVFSKKYGLSPQMLQSKGYLFSQDDEQSFIYLLQHQATQRYVGTVRVFFINELTPIKQMPMQKDGNVKEIDHLTQNLPICEISRLALSQNLPSYPHFSPAKLQTLLALNLMIATRINFFLYPYAKIFAIMERSLERILKRNRVYFEQIGKSVDYYGMTTPFAIERVKLLTDTEETMGEVTRFYLEELSKNPTSLIHFIDNNPYLNHTKIDIDKITTLFKNHGKEVDLNLLVEA